MQRLKVISMGDHVQGVRLTGNPSRPEPESFRVCLADWGDVDIVRCTDDSYWVHIRINHPEDGIGAPTKRCGRVIDGRVDHVDKAASETISLANDLGDPNTYHAAIRVGVSK